MDILKYENSFKNKGYKNIVGIDEAGRGPLAGPVVSVAINWGEKAIIPGVKDSKKISEKKRLTLFEEIISNAKDFGVGIVHEDEIDEINILQATYLSMRKAIGSLSIKPDLLLVDGNRADIHHIDQKNIIKGDSLSYSIACASIVAKVTRDKIMYQYDIIFPDYGFAKHKGYGTKLHIGNIKNLYACPIHRKSFKPIIDYLPTLKLYKEKEKIHLLGKELVGLYLIKKGFTILLFNDKYDLVYINKKILFIATIDILIKDEIIHSKADTNNINFKSDMSKLLSDMNIDYIKKIKINSVKITLLKKGSKTKITEKENIDL